MGELKASVSNLHISTQWRAWQSKHWSCTTE